MTELDKRVIELSYKFQSSHIGSCLSVVNILDKIYATKNKEDIVILSNGHAGLALYVVLEKHEGKNAEELFKKFGTHPDKDDGIFCSTGSLGHGIGIGVGAALADSKRNVYIVISDGECAEGSIWESLAVARKYQLENLRITLIANGYSAYDKVDIDDLDTRINSFYPILTVRFNMFAYPDELQGLKAHYSKLNKETYEEIIC